MIGYGRKIVDQSENMYINSLSISCISKDESYSNHGMEENAACFGAAAEDRITKMYFCRPPEKGGTQMYLQSTILISQRFKDRC